MMDGMGGHDPNLAEALRSHGLQVTAQRLAVLRATSRLSHGTAGEIAESVRAEIGAISRQGLYDVLGALVESGLLRSIRPGDSPTRYERRVGDNHHHLVCRDCGETVDIDCAVGDAPCLDAADDHGFDIDEADVIFWGRCPQCRRAAADGASVSVEIHQAN